MSRFATGMRVRSTEYALRRGIFNSQQMGTVIDKNPERGDLIYVRKDGNKLPTRYSKDFWEPIEEEANNASL